MKKTKLDKKKLLELRLERIRNLTPPELGGVVGGAGVACNTGTTCRPASGCPTDDCPTTLVGC